MKEFDNCDRLGRRLTVLLHGRCHKSSWKVFDVELDNISEGGCCIVGGADRFRQGQSLSLRFANLRNIDADVRWIREGKVGLEFRSALKRRVIEDLGQSYGITVCNSDGS
jgi:hypothetical protein